MGGGKHLARTPSSGASVEIARMRIPSGASRLVSLFSGPNATPPLAPPISAAPMTPFSPDSLRRLRLPAYLIFAVTSIFPLIDLVLTVLPAHPGTVMWRFGSVGLLSSAIGAPLLVLVLIFAVALWAGDRGVV